MTSRTAPQAHADFSQRQVEVVEDEKQIAGKELELSGDPRHGRPRHVHEGLGLNEVEPLAAPLRLAAQVPARALEAYPELPRQRIQHAGAHVVTRVAVLGPGIAGPG